MKDRVFEGKWMWVSERSASVIRYFGLAMRV